MSAYPSIPRREPERPHRSDAQVGNLRHLKAPAALWVALLASAPALAAEWSLEVVDNTGIRTLSVAMENSGKRHISYYDPFNSSRLKYAFYDGTNWSVEVVDHLFTVGEHNSIAVDADGNPHISYHGDYQDGGLKYAVRDAASSTWSVEVVDQGRQLGEYSSLALDSSGNPYISYRDSLLDDLKMAYNTGNGWVIETVDSNGNTGFATSIALHGSGSPRISYGSFGTNTAHLWFAAFDGSWTIEQVEANCHPDYTSLALDESGNPLIAYHDEGFRDLKFASRSGGAWTKQTVASVGSVGQGASLALDPFGSPWISFRDATNQDLQYAKYDGTNWMVETIDEIGNLGSSTALQIDALGNAGISYYDVTNGTLKFAFLRSPVVVPALPPGAKRLLVAVFLGIGLFTLERRKFKRRSRQIREASVVGSHNAPT